MNPDSSFQHLAPDLPSPVYRPVGLPWWAAPPWPGPTYVARGPRLTPLGAISSVLLSLLMVAFGTAGLLAVLRWAR